MSAAQSVSAVVVTYFTGPLLARAIASLRAQPEVAEIVVVDNGNWEGAIDEALAASAGAPAIVLSGHGNIGFAAACNLGARSASGQFLLFLNPDAEMSPQSVRRLLADAASLSRPWLVAPKLVGPDGREQQGSRRRALTPWRAFVEALHLWRLAPRHPYFRRFHLHDDPCPQEAAPVPVISGACFLLPREDYFRIGGMDERYFLHVEDIDFCVRFAKAGGGVWFDPHVEVRHAKSASRVDAIRVERRKTASVVRYFRAHFSDVCPRGFLLAVEGLLWTGFTLKAARRAASRSLALVRRSPAVARRALRFGALRKAR